MEEHKFEPMRFELPKEQSSIIKVIGVGGGGSNAVNYMYEQGIKGVDFIICNTDAQAIEASPVPLKIQLGQTLTEGRGAGSIPEVGRNAAVENLEDVKAIIGNNTTMVFVTAGMGGGTGTGAAPVIAQAAKEMGILTVGIVTVPFMFEGKRRSHQAEQGLEEMRDSVDTLLVIKNDKLRELFGNLPLKKAFDHADEVLCTAAKGIAEVITLTGDINVDMNDVNTVMRDSGVAIMGSGRAAGEGRALTAVHEALESPLLNDNDITGANFVLLNITHGAEEVLMDEITEITDYIQDRAGLTAEVIWGYGPDESLGNDLCVTVIATGFSSNQVDAGLPTQAPEVKKFDLEPTEMKEVKQKVNSPTDRNEPFIIKQETPAEPTVAETKSIDEELEDTSEWKLITRADQPSLFQEDKPAETTETSMEEEMVEEEVVSEDQMTFETQEIKAEETEEVRRYYLEDTMDTAREEEAVTPTDSFKFTPAEPQAKLPAEDNFEIKEEQPSREEMMMRNKAREARIREISMKLKTPSGISDLEDTPAYLRRNIMLDNTPHSSDSSVSKFALGEEEDATGKKQARLKDDNSFLHDQVD